ncbi:MAG: 2,4-dihydroxyhept-2-ene-1,7-dioic acid aldolase [Gammaproteobacteria bacterium]|nr:2,4-dihydroxyhept-2-ene-1,7-dioic acid aldolase [Gammaproteobacteria bacterium]
MSELSFRARLRQREVLIGTIASLASPEAIEVLAGCGFDWLFLETEHAPVGPAELQHLIIAAHGLPCVVRLPNHDEIGIKRAFDAGAAGIIVPQVNTAEQAAAIVAGAKFPPQGRRGVGVARANGYGYAVAEYVARANDETAVIVQAEHIDAVHNIEAIVQVPGLDSVFVGPYDLSASMGRLGQLDHPEVVAAIKRVADVTLAANLTLGFFATSPEWVIPRIAAGFTFIACGVDTLFLRQGASAVREALK